MLLRLVIPQKGLVYTLAYCIQVSVWGLETCLILVLSLILWRVSQVQNFPQIFPLFKILRWKLSAFGFIIICLCYQWKDKMRKKKENHVQRDRSMKKNSQTNRKSFYRVLEKNIATYFRDLKNARRVLTKVWYWQSQMSELVEWVMMLKSWV